MSLPRLHADVVADGAALDRADTPDELEHIWTERDCDRHTGKARSYLMGIYSGVIARCQRNARALDLARAD